MFNSSGCGAKLWICSSSSRSPCSFTPNAGLLKRDVRNPSEKGLVRVRPVYTRIYTILNTHVCIEQKQRWPRIKHFGFSGRKENGLIIKYSVEVNKQIWLFHLFTSHRNPINRLRLIYFRVVRLADFRILLVFHRQTIWFQLWLMKEFERNGVVVCLVQKFHTHKQMKIRRGRQAWEFATNEEKEEMCHIKLKPITN